MPGAIKSRFKSNGDLALPITDTYYAVMPMRDSVQILEPTCCHGVNSLTVSSGCCMRGVHRLIFCVVASRLTK